MLHSNWRWLAAAMVMTALMMSWGVACGDDDDDDDNDAADDDTADDDTGDDDTSDDDTADDDDDYSIPEVEYEYEVPVKSTSPWPQYRRTARNNGRSPVMPSGRGLDPWSFDTSKSMFHEPVIDSDGTIYMGAADTNFYAINPDGTEKWRFATGEIVDSTAMIAEDGSVYMASGDGYLYKIDPANGTEQWRLAADGSEEIFITWWEGHMSMGPDGRIYAGNDDRNLYAITQAGNVDWKFPVGDQIWSAPGFAKIDGKDAVLFGSNDASFYVVDFEGNELWSKLTLGPVTSAPSVSDDGTTVYIASFDGNVRAFDLETGDKLWQFEARDHIYASVSIAADGTLYVGSADGTMYALNPDGTLKWAFDTLDPIRSAASIDGEGNLYFGSANGKVYALRPDGTKWWSYDASSSDRNDLNGPPAIHPNGIVIGGEEARLHFIPFDYCDTAEDERCDTAPGEGIPDNGTVLYYYTAGGTSTETIEEKQLPTSTIVFRLVVREDGDTLRRLIDPGELDVKVTPNFDFRVEVSGDGNFFSIIPEENLALDTEYDVEISGEYRIPKLRIGNRVVSTDPGDSFEGEFTFTTDAATGGELPLSVGDNATDVLWFKRMAVPQPPMMTTFNQIGFDSYNYFFSAVDISEAKDKFVMLVVQGTPGTEPEPLLTTKSIFAVTGDYTDSYFAMEGTGFVLDITNVSITLDDFRVAGQLNDDKTSPPMDAYAEVVCENVEFFGPQLRLLGLCQSESDKLIANGTALFGPAPGGLGEKPAGLSVKNLKFKDPVIGSPYIEATFDANALMADEELPVIVLADKSTFEAVNLTYGTLTTKEADGEGHLASVRLTLPKDFDPDGLTAYVTVNLYPVYEETLSTK
ncbi:PQQ-like beta-propeller repeat protein [bacterium]|nr:PQQ-like beta-propeller repeat protein [bacterium]